MTGARITETRTRAVWDIHLDELRFRPSGHLSREDEFRMEAWVKGYYHSIHLSLTGHKEAGVFTIGEGPFQAGLFESLARGGRHIGHFRPIENFPVTMKQEQPSTFDLGSVRRNRLTVHISPQFCDELSHALVLLKQDAKDRGGEP